MAEDVQELGIYGFGAVAHIVTQRVLQQCREVYAFTRPNDLAAQQFALQLGQFGLALQLLRLPEFLMPH